VSRGKRALEILVLVSLVIGFFVAASLYLAEVDETTWNLALEKTGCPIETSVTIFTPYILKGLLVSLITFLIISFVGAFGGYGLIFGGILLGCFFGAGSPDRYMMIIPVVYGTVIGFMLRKSSRGNRAESRMF
jgi:hypothetical protein